MIDAVPAIVATFRQGLSVSEACRRSNVSRRTFYDWMRRHATFREIVRTAMSIGHVAIENELRASGALSPMRGSEDAQRRLAALLQTLGIEPQPWS